MLRLPLISAIFSLTSCAHSCPHITLVCCCPCVGGVGGGAAAAAASATAAAAAAMAAETVYSELELQI